MSKRIAKIITKPFFKSKLFLIGASSILIIVIVLPIVLTNLDDTVPPSLQITNPLDSEILSGTVSIEILSDDNGSIGAKVVRTEIYVDDILKASASTYDWDTTTSVDGFHTIKVKVFDKANNTAEEEISVVVDNFINPAPSNTMKVMTYNVLESGINPEWKDVVKAENADIIMFIETGLWDNKDNKRFNLITNEFNGYFYDYAPYDGYTNQDISYSTQGAAIMSRYPIISINEYKSVILDDESSHYLASAFLHAVVDVYGTEVHIIGVHLKCCAGEFEEWRREREQEGFNNYMDDLGDVPIIYLGDLNSLSPDDVGPLAGNPLADFGYGPVTMLLYPENDTYGNFSSEIHTFSDTFRPLHPSDPGYTLNVPTIDSRIDYIFLNQHFNNTLISSNIGSTTGLDSVASDHNTVEAIIDIQNITSIPAQRLSQDIQHKSIKVHSSRITQNIRKVELMVISNSPIFIFETELKTKM